LCQFFSLSLSHYDIPFFHFSDNMTSTITETRSNDQVDEITTKSLEKDPLTHSIPHSESLQSSSSSTNTTNIYRNRKDGSKTHELLKTIAGVAGNILEWYDFAVFGYFSDVLGRVFFPPNQEGHSAMIESFAVFGLAFLCRPIGGMILGYIGDTYGRKRALEISIFLMAFPTFAMGCLPSYEHVGVWAIVLLTLVRMLQGLSVGGQLVSSLVFTLENNPKEKWGLYGSYVMAAANFGTLLGGLMSFSMRRLLTEEQLFSWGWRVPFLSGILVSFCGIYLRYSCEEESIQHHSEASSRNNPILAAFGKGNRRGLLCASLVPMLWSAGFYLSFVWMATFMDSLIDDAVPNAFGVNSASLFLSVCLLFPLAGILSDKIGRRKVMFMGGIAMGLLSPLMVIVISQGNAAKAFFCQTIMGISLSLWGAPSK
jgi:MHS family proline/betaine transporter-like MFS transporter